jgi:hypothetical protein
LIQFVPQCDDEIFRTLRKKQRFSFPKTGVLGVLAQKSDSLATRPLRF